MFRSDPGKFLPAERSPLAGGIDRQLMSSDQTETVCSKDSSGSMLAQRSAEHVSAEDRLDVDENDFTGCGDVVWGTVDVGMTIVVPGFAVCTQCDQVRSGTAKHYSSTKLGTQVLMEYLLQSLR